LDSLNEPCYLIGQVVEKKGKAGVIIK